MLILLLLGKTQQLYYYNYLNMKLYLFHLNLLIDINFIRVLFDCSLCKTGDVSKSRKPNLRFLKESRSILLSSSWHKNH